MPDSIGHHRRCKAGREVKVSTAYLGGLAVSDKHGTVVTSANTTRATGRTARSPMRSYCVRQENIKLFHSMLLVTLFVRCLFIAIRISHGKV